jgi:predicted permease
VLLAVVGVVLLNACANVANLMLARGAARRHEMAVRLALGASRWRLAQQLLAESVVIAAAGAAIAVLFAGALGRAIVAQLSTFKMPIVLNVETDWRMLTFLGVTMIGTTLLFGIAPALRAARVPPAATVQNASRLSIAGSAAGRLSTALIAGQVALSLALVVTAALLAQSFARLSAAPLGFERDRAVVVSVSAPAVPAIERTPLYGRIVDALQQVPGVANVGGSMNAPLAGTLLGNFVVSKPGIAPAADAEPFSQSDWITPGFVGAYGLRLLAGRDFSRDDRAGRPRVIIVNEAFARRYIEGDAIGRSVAITYRMPAQGDYSLGDQTIVGVVNDSIYRVIRDAGHPTVYFPLAQEEGPNLQSTFFIAVRAAAGSPALLSRSVSEAILAVRPDLTMTIRPLSQQIDAALAQDRVVASLAGFFGVLSMLLAALGVYGVTAHAVARRRIEIGIRMALGAAPSRIVREVLARLTGFVLFGLAIGTAAGFAAARVLDTVLYGVRAFDVTTFTGAAVALGAVSAIAAFVPARRAARVDPMVALRAE